MKLRYGLGAKFALLAGIMMLVALAVFVAELYRQHVMQREVMAMASASMHTLASERLRSQGEATSAQAAAVLVNPMYYFDLDQIGRVIGGIGRLPDVDYVVVFDNDGRIVHDGSRDIASYGQQMSDPLAAGVLAATSMHVQETDDLFDIAVPVMIGEQRLGGVRIGYSLAPMRADHDKESAVMEARLEALATRNLFWNGLRLVVLAVLMVVAALYLRHALVQPVRRLADAARKIEAGHFGVTVPVSERSDEIGELTRAFAHMGESIARHDRDIRHMAYTDALTGVVNRLGFREILDRRLDPADGGSPRLALLFTDLDDFKRINDTFGHECGDEVLVQCAARMREAIARQAGCDAVLARFGGDEFVILLQADDAGRGGLRTRASELAGALAEELKQPMMVQGRLMTLGISIGITLYPEDATGATALLKNADMAMYQAKVAGKQCHRFYSQAMDLAVERRVRMEQDLGGAWERGELSLAYQPIHRMSDRVLVGAEALLRWKHPEDGQLSPTLFVDVAEQSGLIEQIGPQALRMACSDVRRWQQDFASARELFVSVNVSPRQLRSGTFAEQVEGVLRDTGLDGHSLHLELTETGVIGDEARASALLARLRRSGVKVWLDDFGTGFSGLSHLRRVPVDGVKIDRSFVADVLYDPEDLALTTAIVAMAHSLGIDVVAEGIEQEGQYSVLLDSGCDMGQGFWLGRPVGAEEFAALLEQAAPGMSEA